MKLDRLFSMSNMKTKIRDSLFDNNQSEIIGRKSNSKIGLNFFENLSDNKRRSTFQPENTKNSRNSRKTFDLTASSGFHSLSIKNVKHKGTWI